MSQQNVETLRRAYEAFSRGDLDAAERQARGHPVTEARHRAARTSIDTGGRVTGNGSSRPSPRHDGTGVVSAAGVVPHCTLSPPDISSNAVSGSGLPDPVGRVRCALAGSGVVGRDFRQSASCL